MGLYSRLRKAAHGGATALKKGWDSGRSKLDPAAAKKYNDRFKGAFKDLEKLMNKALTTAEGGITQGKKNLESATTQGKTNLQSATTQGKKNLQSATTTARSNLHGVTTAARTGVHTGVDQAKAFAHKATDTLKAGWDQARGKGPKETGGGGTGASQAAMGSSSETSEKSGKFGSKAQLGKGKRKKGNTGKDKLKVRRTGPQ